MKRTIFRSLVGATTVLSLFVCPGYSPLTIEELTAGNAEAQDAVGAPSNATTPSPLSTETPTPSPQVSLPSASLTPIAPPPAPDIVPPAEKTIGAAGAQITSPDGKATLTFPPGATEEPLLVRVTQKPAHDAPPLHESEFLNVWQFDAEASARGKAPVHNFKRNLVIDLKYKPEDLFGRRADAIRYWFVDEKTGAWVEVPVRAVGPYHWRVEIDHFSTQASSSDGMINLPPILDAAQVNLNNGASTFAYPIDVVPGIGKVTPALSLSYSSARVDETSKRTVASPWVGLGWDLAVPSITKQGSGSGAAYFLNMDGFGGQLVRDGNSSVWMLRDHKFIEITHSTSCESTDDNSQAEADQIRSDNYSCNWTVRDQNGLTWIFGGTPGVAGSGKSRRFYAAFNMTSYADMYIYQWDLSSVTDLHGNAATYEYQQTQASLNFFGGPLWQWSVLSSYPKKITYPGGQVEFTLRAETTPLQYMSAPDGSPVYVRPDINNCYEGNSYETRALDRITVRAWEGGAYQDVRQYVMAYDYSQACTGNNNVWSLSDFRLKSITAKGLSGGTHSTTDLEYASQQSRLDENVPFLCTPQTYEKTRTGMRLTKVKNGFGGESEFGYVEAHACINNQYSRLVATTLTKRDGTTWPAATAPDVVTTYEFGSGPKWVNGQYRGFETAKVIDPTTNYVKHRFILGDEGGSLPGAAELAGREWWIETYENPPTGADILWSKVEHEYLSNPVDDFGAYHNRLYRTTTTGKDNKKAMVEYGYTSNGRVSSIFEDGDTTSSTNVDTRIKGLDYYPTPVGGTLVALKSETTYGTPGSETFYFYDGVTTASGGAPLASPNTRGNLTAVRRRVTNSPLNYQWELFSYYTNGQVKEQSVPIYGNSTHSADPITAGADGAVWTTKGRTLLQYDAGSGNRLTSTETVFVYDYTGSAATVPSQTTTYAYDATTRRLGVAKSITAPTGAVREMQYDEFGRTIKLWTSPENAAVDQPGLEYTYDWSATTAGLNKTTEKRRLTLNAATTMNTFHCIDGLGRERQKISPGGSVNRADFVTFGAVGAPTNKQTSAWSPAFNCLPATTSVPAPNNYVEYDAIGQALTTTNSDPGTPVACSPSCSKVIRSGRVTQTIDQEKRKTESEVDGLGRVVKVREYTGTGTGPDPYVLYATTTYEYNTLDGMTKVIDNSNNQTLLTYDQLGRKLSLDDPDMSGGNNLWEYKYDAAGNLTYEEDSRNSKTTLRYDSLNRLRRKEYDTTLTSPLVTDPPDVVLTYDQYDADPICAGLPAAHAIGKLTGMTDGTGATRWCYDVRARELKKRHTVNHPECSTSRTLDVQRTYDTGDRVITMTYPDGEVLTFLYRDNLSHQGGLMYNITSSTGEVIINSVTYASALAAPASITFGASPNAVLLTTYTRDARYRLQRTSSTVNSTTPQDINFEYYENGNVKRINDAAAVDDTYYNYDTLNRLVDMRQGSLTGTILSQYAYAGTVGKLGNLTSKTEGGPALNIAYGDVHHVHAPSSDGTYGYTYDNNGNVTARGTAELFKYDVENRLLNNQDKIGAAHLQNDYSYDGQGNLVKRRTTTWDASGPTDAKDVYVDSIYEETSNSCGAPSQVRKMYPAFGRMAAVRIGGTLHYALADHLNSTSGLVTAATGLVTGSTKYWPYGAIRSGTPAIDKAYTGQQRESVTTLGAYHYGARFYSSHLGRFLSADPLTTDGLNRYAYARNNPVRYNDPTGHCVGGLYCDASKALNIAVCSRGAEACGAVFFAMGLAYDEKLIADAVRFSQVAWERSDYQTNLFVRHSPFLRQNYGVLKAGYTDPGYADALLLSLAPEGMTVEQIHDEFEARESGSSDVINEYNDICGGGRCLDAVLDAADLTLIVIGLQSGNPGWFLTVAEGSLYTAEVQQHWQAYLAGEEPLEAVWWSVGGGFGNLAQPDVELIIFAMRKYAEVFCGSPPNPGCGYRE